MKTPEEIEHLIAIRAVDNITGVEMIKEYAEARVNELKQSIQHTEKSPCKHEYKAIYLGMGYVRICQKCGDVKQ